MVSFSIWHLIIVLLLVGGMFGIPVLAIRKENTDIRLKRLQFLYWIIGGYLIIPAIFGYVMGTMQVETDTINAIGFLYGIAVAYPVFQRIVRRARDAGKGKKIAYLSIIPFVNIVTMLMLIFTRSVEETQLEQSP
ncbi:MAG: DUF805 domain-containing protein [Rhodospirillaceae bacterium]|nr:DUF805 domain-containing protein [Rhodospirillaceae bacterium]MBT5561856.1 DUF805 domain-containing protein [Rhodospirillaceae bacterium]